MRSLEPPSPEARPGAEAEQLRLEEDFAYYLAQGADHLRTRRLEDARIALERAFQISPYSAKAQNLLGLVYFKLGLLEAARSIYDRLVVDYPNEAPLSVNLGLVLLRQGRLREAERALRRAIQLSPGHKRAHAYLGLVLYRRGDLQLAHEHFLLGRAVEFAKKIEDRLRTGSDDIPSHAELLRRVGADANQALEERVSPFKQLDPEVDTRVVRDEEAWEAVVTHSRGHVRADLPLESSSSIVPIWALGSDLPEGAASTLGSLEPVPTLPTLAPAPAPAIATKPAPPSTPANGAPFDDRTPAMTPLFSPTIPAPSPPGESTPNRGWEEPVPPREASMPEHILWSPPSVSSEYGSEGETLSEELVGFEAGPGARGRLGVITHAYLRASAIVAASGHLRMRDARGASGFALGGRLDPLCLLEGRGVVLARVKQLAVALRGAGDLHVVESVLAGFDDGFEWERTRVLNLDVVSLRGRGTLLLDTMGAPLLMPVEPETPVHAAEEVLLAWSEGVRPAPVDVTGAEGRLLRLRGRGYVLVAFPPESPPPSRAPEKAGEP